MGIRDLLDKLRGRRDDAANAKEAARQIETPEEQAVTSGDIQSLAADAGAARRIGEGSMSDVDRLGDGE